MKQASWILSLVQSKHTFLERWRAGKWLGGVGAKENRQRRPHWAQLRQNIRSEHLSRDWPGRSPIRLPVVWLLHGRKEKYICAASSPRLIISPVPVCGHAAFLTCVSPFKLCVPLSSSITVATVAAFLQWDPTETLGCLPLVPVCLSLLKTTLSRSCNWNQCRCFWNLCPLGPREDSCPCFVLVSEFYACTTFVEIEVFLSYLRGLMGKEQ